MKQLYLLLFCFLTIPFQSFSQYTSWLTGDAADVQPTAQAGLILAGGSTDNDDAMTWFADRANGGDVVVIRSSGSDGYNDYLFGLSSINSIETILITSTAIANNPEVEQKIRDAEALFIAGGDQFNYVSFWKGTLVEDALNYLINEKNVTVGGTSAGLAILGDAYFSAENGTVVSSEALSNPYHNRVALGFNDFLDISLLENTITDSHYNDPDRRGRHMVFQARMSTDWGIDPKGIGINETVAVCVDETGTAFVYGNASDDFAYFSQGYGGTPENCVQGQPLDWNRNNEAVKVYKVLGTTNGANSFNLNTWTDGSGGEWQDFYVSNGALNIIPNAEPPTTGDATALISEVQGSGFVSPMDGSTVTLDGIVVADFQDTNSQLSGFFIQEEDADADGNSLTSEGIFIFDDGFGVDVSVGDLVSVTGVVDEFFEMTEIVNITSVNVLSSNNSLPLAATLNLPATSNLDFEAVEGMLVSIPQTLFVTETFGTGRFGEVALSSGGILDNPTNVVSPGTAANSLQAANDLNRITLDDASEIQNPDPTPYLFGNGPTLRLGDQTTGLTGVVNYGFDLYRIQPTNTPNFTRANPRTTTPTLASSTLKVASFNVLNYFNGNGQGGGFPTSRGADTFVEFNRQKDKIIEAMVAIDADILGLVEIENDGFGANSAIQDLVNALNDATASNINYTFVQPSSSLGTDEITVALIYKTETVETTGTASTTLSAPFDNRRPPLAQTFRDIASGEQMTIAVNHFKSKGCGGSTGNNADQGDGQGCWNQERIEASNTLMSWLATNPTGSADPDILIIGDLNAYAMEDPITTLAGGGYTDLVASSGNNDKYSFVFNGQVGYLDHALSSSSLVGSVEDVTIWKINADEPIILDYNEEFKSPAQQALNVGTPYRSSDHNPVIVGLTLDDGPVCTATVPSGLSISAIGQTSATASWSAVANVVSYDYQYREVGAASWTVVNTTSTSVNITGLTAITDYEVQVRSNCSDASSAYSASSNFTTLDVDPPCTVAVPTGLASSGVTSSGADISWNSQASATAYDYQYRATGAASWTVVNTAATSASISGLAADTEYEFQVRAICPDQTSAYSASSNFTTDQVGGASCDVAPALSASGITESSATISWPAIDGVTNHSYRYRLATGGSWTTGSTTASSVTISGLSADTEYEFRMRASCTTGNSPLGSINFTTTDGGTPTCDVPGGLASSGVGETTATISWNAVSIANTYDVRYRETGAASWIDLSVSGTSTALSGLTADTDYEFQVQSNCTGEVSGYSASSNFTTTGSGATCDVPGGLASSGVGETTATISWNAVSIANTYDVRYRETGAASWIDLSVSGTSTALSVD